MIVNRLEPIASDGTIGVFDSAGQLIGLSSIECLVNESDTKPLVRLLTAQDLFTGDAAIDFSETEQATFTERFYKNYDALANHPFFEQTHTTLSSIPINEQGALIKILEGKNTQFIDAMRETVRLFGPDALRACLLLEMRMGEGDIFYRLCTDQQITVANLKHAVSLIVHQAENTRDAAQQVAAELHSTDAKLNISEIMLARGIQQAFIDDVYQFLKKLLYEKKSPELQDAELESFVSAQKKRIAIEMAAIGSVKEFFGITQFPTISLDRYREYGQTQAGILENPGVKAAVIEVLCKNGRLAPVPEIHWRVDRTTAEYERRLGVDLKKVYAHIQGGSRKPIVLEFGQGSGKAKQERQLAMGSVEFTIIDQGYYSVADQIRQLLAVVDLPEEQKKILADVLYKKMVIDEYDAEAGTVKYNNERLERLATDPASIFEGLQMAAQSLRNDDVLPLSMSKHVANADAGAAVIYPNHFSVDSVLTPEMRGALEHVGVISGTAETALAAIQFHPGNALFADFDVVQKMQSDEVSLALGVRSSVYKRGEAWVKHGVEVARILEPGGLWIDDSLRDNDGYRYRLSEAQALQQEIASSGCEIFAVIGPGFEGEDARGNEAVPLALIVAKPPIDSAAIQGFALDGYEIVSLGEAANNTAWYDSVEQAVA